MTTQLFCVFSISTVLCKFILMKLIAAFSSFFFRTEGLGRPDIEGVFFHIGVDWMNSPTNVYWKSPISIFRCVRLCDLDIPREKWLYYLQTMETLIRRRVLRRLIWVCIVCQLPLEGFPDYNGLNNVCQYYMNKNILKLSSNLLTYEILT